VREEIVGALELGGTHVTVARVSLDRRAVDGTTLRRAELSADASRNSLLRTIRSAAAGAASAEAQRWGVATPGPFDYERGISTIRGVAKLDALYGVDLRSELATALRVSPRDIRFLNDAAAFLLGEGWAGAARGHDAVMGITLGSGLGSAFLRDGTLRREGPGVPPDARLDLLPFRGAPVEEVISRRGLLAAYRRTGQDAFDVIEIAERARAGENAAIGVFSAFGASLGEFLAPVLERFEPSCLVVGGAIARSWSLFADAFRASCPPAARVSSVGVAQHLDEAPLLGAARYATAG
jgi:glucokinase